MTATTEEKYDPGTVADDFAAADDPPEEGVPAGQDFTAEAPYGWRRDPDTGQMVPKKRPGRPGKPRTPEQVAAAEPITREPDPPPGGRGRGKREHTAGPAPAMPRGGVIAAGVNKLYRRAGKVLRAFDHDIGQAVIECTRTEDLEEGELTVGEAWENLCKANPRIRRFVMKAIAGGAWGDLVMAHAPIGIALVMKPAVQRFIPWGRLVESMAEPDDDTPEGEGGLPGGMTAADFDELKQQATEQARRMAARMHIPVSDKELADAAASVGVPPGFRRAQPRAAGSRAKRRGR
jgi:hypothetical protein